MSYMTNMIQQMILNQKGKGFYENAEASEALS